MRLRVRAVQRIAVLDWSCSLPMCVRTLVPHALRVASRQGPDESGNGVGEMLVYDRSFCRLGGSWSESVLGPRQ